MSTTAEQSALVLKEAKTILDKLGIPFCLFLGTSLGAYRDGTFCPGDADDIDLAIKKEHYSRAQEIRDAFVGWEAWNEWKPQDNFAPEMSFFKRHNPTSKTKVDLFFIEEADDNVAFRFYRDLAGEDRITKYMDKKFFDSFDKVHFFGDEYNIPGHIEEYLEANYGDWKTPVHRMNFSYLTDNKLCEHL